MSHGDGEVEKLVASHSSGGRRNREQEGGGGERGDTQAGVQCIPRIPAKLQEKTV